LEEWKKGGPKYSEEADKIIHSTLQTNYFEITKEYCESLISVFPQYFNERNAFSIFLHLKVLAKEHKWPIKIISTPKRVRPPRPRKPTVNIKRKASLHKQLNNFLIHEFNAIQRKVFMFMQEYNKELIKENQELKEELKALRPYKSVVDKHYKREIENFS
jgi:hypothetical protein